LALLESSNSLRISRNKLIGNIFLLSGLIEEVDEELMYYTKEKK
jgi:hypothetical protein